MSGTWIGRRGTEIVTKTELVVLNTASMATFQYPGNDENIPDVTFASELLVLERFSLNNHQCNVFNVVDTISQCVLPRCFSCAWKTWKVSVWRFGGTIGTGGPALEVTVLISIADVITTAWGFPCSGSTQSRQGFYEFEDGGNYWVVKEMS